jgi:hypothetical protein
MTFCYLASSRAAIELAAEPREELLRRSVVGPRSREVLSRKRLRSGTTERWSRPFGPRVPGSANASWVGASPRVKPRDEPRVEASADRRAQSLVAPAFTTSWGPLLRSRTQSLAAFDVQSGTRPIGNSDCRLSRNTKARTLMKLRPGRRARRTALCPRVLLVVGLTWPSPKTGAWAPAERYTERGRSAGGGAGLGMPRTVRSLCAATEAHIGGAEPSHWPSWSPEIVQILSVTRAVSRQPLGGPLPPSANELRAPKSQSSPCVTAPLEFSSHALIGSLRAVVATWGGAAPGIRSTTRVALRPKR